MLHHGLTSTTIGRYPRMSTLRKGQIVALAALVCLVVSSCSSASSIAKVQFKGKVYGEALSLAATTPVPLAAKVTCNGASTTASADGSFLLSVPKAAKYACSASLAPQYGSVSVDISAATGFGDIIDLSFETPQQSTCSQFPGQNSVECAALKIRGGTVHGVVQFTTGGPASGGNVVCANTGATAEGLSAGYDWPEATVDAQGNYTVETSRSGTVACIAYSPKGDAVRQELTVQAGETAVANFTVCDATCHAVHYHSGPVMHTQHDYLIFWQPKGTTFEPGGSDASFQSLVKRYFNDVGGTPFYGLLSQYFDYQGNVQNSVSLAGVWVDTGAYLHCGTNITHCSPATATKSDPLVDSDIQGEVLRSFQANPTWKPDPTNEFFVFTAAGSEECQTDSRSADCTFSASQQSYCAYHSFFSAPAVNVNPITLYAYIPSAANGGGRCSLPSDFSGPNHDNIADATLDSVSHEQFETVSDPTAGTGWYDDSSAAKLEGEIGDKCEQSFGTLNADDSNVVLHGDPYLLQQEWSNKVNGCAFS